MALGQSLRKVEKWVFPRDRAFFPDSLTIITPTLKCLSDTSFRFLYDFRSGKVLIISPGTIPDSIRIVYYAYPFQARKPWQIIDLNRFDSLLRFADYPGMSNPKEKREELFEMPGIQKSGVISRGIRLGNGQNGLSNSSMNLQLEGNLAPGVRLSASLSDQSVPFQPEGNTQQVRELDQVLIQLDHKQARLMAGDVVLKNEDQGFLRFYKNIQGAQVQAFWDTSGNSTTRIGAGVAKGKFASVLVPVREGVQGPYRLRPPNNPDILVVILANSEKVFLDTRLLRRGFDLDYIIDYNTGEITLNNSIQITRFSRLRCDFEYAERNYSRSVVMAGHQETIGHVKLGLEHYQEQDQATRPLGFSLDSTSASILQNAGDDPLKAVLPGFEAIAQPAEGQLVYQRKDTLIDGLLRPWFRLAPEGQTNSWIVRFAEVGLGKGDYLLNQGLGNGKWYVYAGPGKGNFLPVRFAVLPNKRQLNAARIQVNLGKDQSLEGELAFSQYDRNRLSRFDENDNSGNAQRIGYAWNPAQSSHWKSWKAGITYTRLSKNFQFIDRFRSIEFERDWNGNSGDTLISDDHLVENNMEYAKGRLAVRQSGAWRNKGTNVRGFQQNVSIDHHPGPFRLQHSGFFMRNIRSQESASWTRLKSFVEMDKFKWRPSYQFDLDENTIRRTESDSILRSAMYFKSHQTGIRHGDSTGTWIEARYIYREDQAPESGQIRKVLYSQNAEWKASWDPDQAHRLGFVGNWRKIRDVRILGHEENISGRFDYQGAFWKGNIRQEFVFTANTGQEAKRDFQFVRIASLGEGTHQWLDINQNGIQELDEFVEAQRTEDRQFIKVFVPSSELVKAYANGLNYRLNFTFPSEWRSQKGLRKGLASFSLLTSITADQKQLSGSFREKYLPFSKVGQDALISANRVFRNTVFWNRTRSDFGGEYSYLESNQKSFLSNGFALRSTWEHKFLFRKTLGSYFSVAPVFSFGARDLNSNALSAQNYALRLWEVNPELAFQPGSTQRLTFRWVWAEKQNQMGEEKSRLSKLALDYRWNALNNRSLNGSFQAVWIRHNGPETTPAAYELLEGLLPGQNFTWNLNWQQKLSQGLQLVMVYEGRQSPGIRTIHIGRMQANLLF
jgi:hypothetical protein